MIKEKKGEGNRTKDPILLKSPDRIILPQEKNPLTLAFIGDAVYEMAVRRHLIEQGEKKIRDYHLLAVSYVKAEAQSNTLKRLWEDLTEEEQAIARRGRNTSSAVPKNAKIADYRMATGFEALLGALYLKGDIERLEWLLEKSIKGKVEESNHG